MNVSKTFGLEGNMRKAASLFFTGLMIATGFVGLALPASATPSVGVGDVTQAMIYETTPGVVINQADINDSDSIIGQPVSEITGRDDSSTTVSGPSWPMNFFGNKFEAMCITTNGTITPVVDTAGECTDSFDATLDYLARDSEGPLIAAFSNDGNPGEKISSYLPFDVSSVSLSSDSSEVLTLQGVDTASVQAGLNRASSDDFAVFLQDTRLNNGTGDDFYPLDEIWIEGDISIVNGTTITLRNLSFYNSIEDSITPPGDFSLSNPNFVRVFNPADEDDIETEDNGTDGSLSFDGFGEATTIYEGEFELNGRDAYAVTYYRIGQFENDTPDVLYNTYQIVLIKSDSGSEETGYDFEFQFNFGTVTDGDDGYDLTDEYIGYSSEMRTGVGVVDYNFADGSTNVYELFADTASRDLLDFRDSSALTANRLNSDVLGRYRMQFVGGAPADFAIPVMDGSGETVPRPVQISPISADANQDMEQAPGDGTCYYDNDAGDECSGSLVPLSDSSGYLYDDSDNGFLLEIQGLRDGTPLAFNSDGVLEIRQRESVRVAGEGFRPNSTVNVYIWSDPQFLGSVVTDENGEFDSEFPVPASVPAGNHTIQANGIDDDDDIRSINLGIVVTSAGGFSAPVPFPGPVATEVTQNQDLVTVRGLNLGLVTDVTIGGQAVSFEFVGGLLRIETDGNEGLLSMVYSGGGVLTEFIVSAWPESGSDGNIGETNYWTKKLNDQQVKFYAKNVIGQGKVQFFQNGEEVAWIRAADSTDAKLNVIIDGSMAGSNYLVRTRDMVEGKNAFEIYVDGERVWRAAYTR